MVCRRAVITLLAVTCAQAQDGSVDLDAALARLREFSESYGARLENFTCNKTIDRASTQQGKGNRLSHVDKSEEEIYYVDHKERRKMITLDGKPANGLARPKHGVLVGGEFGLLGNIFSKEAKAKLEWDRMETVKGSPICIFRYRVEEQDAPIVAHMSSRRITMAHHGSIYSHCGTGVVVRLDTASDLEPDKGVEMRTSIRFAPATIGNKEFQLPQSAEDVSRFGKQITKAAVVFRRYRKYEATSDIRFDTEQQ